MPEDCPNPAEPDRGVSNDLAAQAALYRLLVENSVDVIIRYNAARQRIYVSPSSFEMLGIRPVDMVGAINAARIHPDDFPRVDLLFRQVGPALPVLQLSFRVLRTDGVYIWVEAQYRYLAEDGGSVAMLRDITARKRTEDLLAEANDKLQAANNALRALAQQDGLTGLANRRHFDSCLDEEFRRASVLRRPLAVLLLDVDCFKAYNDRYGHVTGDECLRQISRVAAGALRRPGDLAARYGGEEFVMLLPATNKSASLAVAERIRAAVAALRIEHLGSPYRIATVSIGTCCLMPFPGDASTADILNAADRALYQAKAGGRNTVRAGSVEALVVAA
jgi:diguanylate cyclase (GGDEF)-like protein/PAS domain S-box-containing protein